jgi:hypothetical protein
VASQLKTDQFSYHMASAFANSFLNDSIYMYIGRSSQWTDEAAATPAATDVHTDHIDIWNHMAGAVRISRNEVALGIKTHIWASGVVYEKYEDASTSLGDGTGYYVLAGLNNRCVYKCLDNNGDEGSTSKPTHKYQTSLREPDNYIWKYMYEMSVSEAADFNSAEATFVPYSGGRGTSSGSGSILNIVVPANASHGIGESYRGSGFSNGTVGISLYATANIGASVLSACNELVLRSDQGGLSDTDDFYDNCSIMITSGDSQGKVYNVNGYIGASKTLTVTPNVDRVLIGDTFKIGPKITIIGDGAGLTAIGNVNGFGNLKSITVATIGSGYSNVKSVLVGGDYSTGVDGTGATASIYVPPSGGHGSNPASELEAKYAIAVGKLPLAGGSNDGDGYFAGYGQRYRHVGLLRNPLTTDSTIARGSSYDLRTHLYFDSTQQAFLDLSTTFPTSPPSVVTNANTGATGEVWNLTNQGANWHVTLVNVVANSGLTFSNGQYVSTPSGSAYISSANLDQFSYKGNPPVSSALPGQLDKYSGEIIYHEDNPPNFIAQNSQDNIQITFEF